MKKQLLITGISCALLSVISARLTAQTPQALMPKMGKYGCTASKYRGGSYEYIPHGSFTLNADGTYFYSGFEKPSKGKYTVDQSGNLLFTGGYLDHGKAEKIDRPDKFFLVFPTIPDNRWTCSYVGK
ncbi:hypothetical protein [Hymenobacter properus]|uniref:Uncharacterized protein n=1 Tax=Hymenobacter properus TaxID=2791026 RepID=A0A931BD78_9BACT|nr:hypothetical protein [Hymenobacter properus]MBF9141184.1 hypothetical protein [Hymenobacter properus]MBR7719993.1 hypothetical protein [Microvirga sp. SRT04]